MKHNYLIKILTSSVLMSVFVVNVFAFSHPLHTISIYAETPEYEAIDLGLPSGVKWASFNVGATKPEDVGDYYAWGETHTKQDYSLETYKWYDGTFTKYNADDNKIVLDLEDDVAHVKWGTEWRIPSAEDVQELIDNSTWTWTTINGVKGNLVTGPNGNSIFLPATGAYFGDELFTELGLSGYYQINRVGGYEGDIEDNYDNSQYLFFYREQLQILCHYRHLGKVVRPVCGTPITYMVSISSDGNGAVTINDTDDSSVTVDNRSHVVVKAIPNKGYEFIGWYLNGADTPISTALIYEFVVTGNIELIAKFKETTTIMDNRAIDLGLPSGIKWASYNVGANKPEEFGCYYAWGETEEKRVFNLGNYKWYNTSVNSIMKYCTNEVYGNVDSNLIIDLEDDIAHIEWAGEWRMPTMEELNELLKKCVWQRTSVNNVNGYKVIGPNGNSIFLPSAGYYNENGSYNIANDGYYWSSTLYDSDNNKAGFLGWNSAAAVCYYYNRYFGKTVRAVCGNPIRYTVSVHSEKYGTASIGGTDGVSKVLINGSDITIVATPNEGYKFEGWFVNDEKTPVSTDAIYTFTVSDNIKLFAKFYKETIVTEVKAIDLGLPSGIKWASCNMGATSPKDMGGFYAWGEIEQKNEYSYENYKWSDSSNFVDGYYKYSIDGLYIDDKIVLDLEDDVAYVKWGKNWRIPSVDDIQELIDNCIWEYSSEGSLVTGPNGNSIFIPFTGIYVHETLLTDIGTSGYYQSNQLGGYNGSLQDSSQSQDLFIHPNSQTVYHHFRHNGQSVRPVYDPRVRIKISQYGCATFCSDLALDFSNVEGLKAYCAIGYKPSTQTVTMARVMTTGSGQGIFIKGEPGEYIVPVIDDFDEYTLNMLVGTLEPTTVNSTDGAMSNYKFTITDGDTEPMFYPFEDNTTFSAGKAYLQIPTVWLPATSQKSVSIRFDEGETTDIEELEWENGELKGVCRDIQGRVLENPTTGIYIIDGKKVIIK